MFQAQADSKFSSFAFLFYSDPQQAEGRLPTVGRAIFFTWFIISNVNIQKHSHRYTSESNNV